MRPERDDELFNEAVDSDELIIHIFTGNIFLNFREICIGCHSEKSELVK
jgi:hypothetical protein